MIQFLAMWNLKKWKHEIELQRQKTLTESEAVHCEGEKEKMGSREK
jgi:hypothetical protein